MMAVLRRSEEIKGRGYEIGGGDSMKRVERCGFPDLSLLAKAVGPAKLHPLFVFLI